MSSVISDSALIPAPADTLYRIIADYHAGHPRIIPRPPFVGLDVVEGGVGDGTVIRVKIRVLGAVQSYHATITEPEPAARWSRRTTPGPSPRSPWSRRETDGGAA